MNQEKKYNYLFVFNFNLLSNAFVRLTVALNQNKRILTARLRALFLTVTRTHTHMYTGKQACTHDFMCCTMCEHIFRIEKPHK